MTPFDIITTGDIPTKKVKQKRRHRKSNDNLFTVSEVARLFRVDDTTVRRWIVSGGLDAIEMPMIPGGKRTQYRIRRETLIAKGITEDMLKEFLVANE